MKHPKPRQQQIDFLQWEMGVFFHFGIRTFYEGHRDWDGKAMCADRFLPEQLDCDSWIRTVKEFGGKYAILVCKHHDGFANWPSAYSDFSVKHSPWRDGKGDVVQEFVDACRKHDIKVGLYYSPAEAGFQQRTPEEYDDYFINQIGELLQNYGTIDYLWFDGCGSEGHEFNKERIIAAIRGFQPEILIFNMWDPDTRWVGNESGIAHAGNSNLVSSLDFSVMTERKDELQQEAFLPAECDFMMRRRNWFYSEYDVHTVKSVEELMGIYYHSVGQGANFLVNIGPDRRGLLPDLDRERLLEFGEALRRRFAHPLPATVEETEDGLRLILEEEGLVNHIILSEDLTEGEDVQEFSLHASSWILRNDCCIHRGSSIGHKRIVVVPSLKTKEIHLRIHKSRGKAALRNIQVFHIRDSI